MLKNNKGITLIALVITIIVLLILAGVSIAMLTGNNGILTQATTARDNTKEAEIADKINMALNGEFTMLIADGKLSGTTSTEIAAANGLDEDEYTIEPASDVTTEGDVLVITATGTSITGKITCTDGEYDIEPATYPTR